jgi:hypothetical protein
MSATLKQCLSSCYFKIVRRTSVSKGEQTGPCSGVGLLVDQAVLPESIKQREKREHNEITVPLLRKVKGETHARQHLLHNVAVPSSRKLFPLRGYLSRFGIDNCFESIEDMAAVEDLLFAIRMVSSWDLEF